MSVRYIVRVEDQRWSRPMGMRRALRKQRRLLRERMGDSGTVRLKEKGYEWRTPHTLPRHMERLKIILGKKQVGHEWWSVGKVADGIVKVRVIETWPKPADTVGNAYVDQFVGILNQGWPGWRSGGILACKQSGGVWSDHAYGGAVDVFDTGPHMEQIRDKAIANAEALHVKYVILYDRIWSRTNGWYAYTGNYHWHVHISFDHDDRRIACG